MTETLLPSPASFTAIGKPRVRVEDARLVTGRGRFTDDFSLPGQAYAAIVRSAPLALLQGTRHAASHVLHRLQADGVLGSLADDRRAGMAVARPV